MIAQFRGRWSRLGNYSPCLVFYEGHAYNSVEHAYQASKCISPVAQKMVRDQATPATAKKMARHLALRPDWEKVKVEIMMELLLEKFASEPERSILLSTGSQVLVEGNWWHDNFWGNCTCRRPDRPDCEKEGLNVLGTLLMDVRNKLRTGEL
jgi:ribA/ribD-fused uncharacterized protein